MKEQPAVRHQPSAIIKVLLIEDNPGDARLIKEILAEAGSTAFTLEWAPRLSAGLVRLDEGKFDVILLDLGLPDSQGLEAVQKLRLHTRRLPLVVLTGMTDEAMGVKAVREGAQDYLLKGQVDSRLLSRALCYAIERQGAEEALRQSEQECRLLSFQLLAAEEKERKRIAQELHDGIGQSVSALKLRLENHIKKMAAAPAKDRIESLKPLLTVAQGVMDEVRKICMGLRPSTLDDLGLLATITWFCREFQETFPHILVEQEIEIQETVIPPYLKTVIYRVIQETFNNIGRHSQAKQVRLNLQKSVSALELLIEDSGRGFDVQAAMSPDNFRRGLGLPGMRERIELSGGTFAIESAQGRGTIIRASWPEKAMRDVD